MKHNVFTCRLRVLQSNCMLLHPYLSCVVTCLPLGKTFLLLSSYSMCISCAFCWIRNEVISGQSQTMSSATASRWSGSYYIYIFVCHCIDSMIRCPQAINNKNQVPVSVIYLWWYHNHRIESDLSSFHSSWTEHLLTTIMQVGNGRGWVFVLRWLHMWLTFWHTKCSITILNWKGSAHRAHINMWREKTVKLLLTCTSFIYLQILRKAPLRLRVWCYRFKWFLFGARPILDYYHIIQISATLALLISMRLWRWVK